MTRKVLAVTGNRAEYGLLRPVLNALEAEPALSVALAVTGAHFDARFGATIEEVVADGVPLIEAPAETGDGTPRGMVRSFAATVNALDAAIAAAAPDFMLVLGDRHEALAAASAAIYLNIPLLHIHGGDVTQGPVPDSSVRHAITKLAHLHFAASEDSRQRIVRLGEEEWRVHNVGSPAVDNARADDRVTPEQLAAELQIDAARPVVVYCQHPVPSRAAEAGSEAAIVLDVLAAAGEQTVITWPNNDAGGLAIVAEIEKRRQVPHFRFAPSLGRRKYAALLRLASAMVGNSSSGIVESASFGIPVVNVGDRQEGRLHAENVMDVPLDAAAVQNALERALRDTAFRAACRAVVNPYGAGDSGKRIARIVAGAPDRAALLAKRITY